MDFTGSVKFWNLVTHKKKGVMTSQVTSPKNRRHVDHTCVDLNRNWTRGCSLNDRGGREEPGGGGGRT